uniref:Uncharacterized protein n=2 Tax=Anguilla anguilla TaxID=7936 RepID=A0A0E9U8L3_ANGAN
MPLALQPQLATCENSFNRHWQASGPRAHYSH